MYKQLYVGNSKCFWCFYWGTWLRWGEFNKNLFLLSTNVQL